MKTPKDIKQAIPFLIITIIISSQILNLPKVSAKMQSDNYEIQMPNLNFSSGNVSSTNYKLGFTGGQNAPGEYSKAGYKLLAGFWYLKTIIPFTFSLSNSVIDFGVLSANTPATAQTIISVSAGGAGGYQVVVFEDHQLLVDSIGAIIPDTTGDNGDITESNAGLWAQNTTYGFGYTLYGDDVPSPFPSSPPPNSYYKQFADLSKSETPQIIMSSSSVGKNKTATLTYKINIPPTQPSGRYHNVITFIATPSY